MYRGKSLSDRFGLRGLGDWIRRSCGAMLADLKLVDCGSLDVLLYCPDDVAVAGQGDFEINRFPR